MPIQNPVEWSWGQLKAASASVGSASPAEYWSEADAQAEAPAIRRIGVADLRHALAEGVEDFGAHRTDVLFLCAFYPLAGLFLGALVSGYGLLHLVFPLAAGFALVGPVAAIGLMEMSRRRERGEEAGWGRAFGVLRSPSAVPILVLSVALLSLFLLWMLVADAIYNLTLGPWLPASTAAFAHDLFTTPAGWTLIVAGIGAGFLFAVAALAVSVASFALLLDRPVGLETAVRTSIRAVSLNRGAMALWGMIVVGGLILGSLPLFLGLVVVLPVLGHATWHLYRRMLPR
jgi:uncharacterized membrane protein